MMKRTHAALKKAAVYLLLAVFCLAILPAAAEEKMILESGEYRYRVLEDQTAEIVQYTGRGYNVVIPETLDGLTVTSIGKEAFYHNVFQETLVIPDTVRHIGDGAFGLCDIANVTLPGSVTSMDGNPFGFCERMESFTVSEDNPEFYLLEGVLCSRTDKALVYYPVRDKEEGEAYSIPEGTERIRKWAFGGCDQLTAVHIPDTVVFIGEMAFAWCGALEEITVPDSVTEIESAAFMDCRSLKSAVLPAGLAVIPDQLFYECGDLETVTVPDSVTEIRESAFAYCSSLEEVSIPAGVTRIGSSAFDACESLKAVTLPDGITEIEGWTFEGCFRLAEINIPAGVTRIGEAAFRYCGSLTTLAIPDSVAEIGEDAFEECPEELVITGGEGSAAQAYCESHHIRFEITGDAEESR